MAKPKPKSNPQTGALAMLFHEGSRSEYLAQFVFAAFGTAIPVPHQEDTGLDIYCTLVERLGKRAWPRAYFSVQVKSDMKPWVFKSSESVRWIIEHPLPIFLCVVRKSDLRLLVYPTSQRFAAWSKPTHPNRLELVLGTETKGTLGAWGEDDDNKLTIPAPILDFTIQDMLNVECRNKAEEVLKLWIGYDMDNLFRIRSGIHQFRVPSPYETNETEIGGDLQQGYGFREESLPTVKTRLEGLLGLLASHHYKRGELVSAAILAMALRHLDPEDWKPFQWHDHFLHQKLNELFSMQPPTHTYQAIDALLSLVKQELASKGIAEASD